MKRIDELKWIIRYHAHLYYCLDRPEIDDFAYDNYCMQLAELEEDEGYSEPDSPSNLIGSGICKILHREG